MSDWMLIYQHGLALLICAIRLTNYLFWYKISAGRECCSSTNCSSTAVYRSRLIFKFFCSWVLWVRWFCITGETCHALCRIALHGLPKKIMSLISEKPTWTTCMKIIFSIEEQGFLGRQRPHRPGSLKPLFPWRESRLYSRRGRPSFRPWPSRLVGKLFEYKEEVPGGK